MGLAANIQVLVTMGARVSDTNHHGSTALMLASAGGHTATVLYLLEKQLVNVNMVL